MSGKKLKSCVIGHPISHSLSPVIHNHWLNKYGIDGEYTAIDVKPEELESFLLHLEKNGFRGCNITIPHKERAWQILSPIIKADDSLPSKVASLLKAVNTVVVNNGKYTATNTDFLGFARNLLEAQPNYDYENSIAYIIGAGGAAKAIAFALASLQIPQLVVTNRTLEKSFELKDTMVNGFGFPTDNISIIDWSDRNDIFRHCNIVVNTTSLGMKNQNELDVDLSNIPQNSLITDIVYNPLETTFLRKARLAGAITVDGLGMLLHQAAPGFEAWFGKKPEVTGELRNAVLKQLA